MTVAARRGQGEEAALDVDAIVEAASRASVLVVGPGLGKGDALAQSLAELLQKIDLPAILDADAIRLMVSHAPILKNRTAPTVLTPHAGEMAALLGSSSAQVQAARRDAALKAAELTGASVVLKGYGTLTTTLERGIIFNPTGGPWLATAGSGDVHLQLRAR